MAQAWSFRCCVGYWLLSIYIMHNASSLATCCPHAPYNSGRDNVEHSPPLLETCPSGTQQRHLSLRR